MSPIPGEPHEQNREELTTSDGRKVRLKIPGMPPAVKPQKTEERAGEEPPRDDPRPPVSPDVAGL